jgi:hypothetical protein
LTAANTYYDEQGWMSKLDMSRSIQPTAITIVSSILVFTILANTVFLPTFAYKVSVNGEQVVTDSGGRGYDGYRRFDVKLMGVDNKTGMVQACIYMPVMEIGVNDSEIVQCRTSNATAEYQDMLANGWNATNHPDINAGSFVFYNYAYMQNINVTGCVTVLNTNQSGCYTDVSLMTPEIAHSENISLSFILPVPVKGETIG